MPAENPCDVCAGGLTADESVEIGSGKTCGDLLVDALNTEQDSDTYRIMKTLKSYCTEIFQTKYYPMKNA